MFSFLAPYKLLIQILAGALVFGGIYGLIKNENNVGYKRAVADYTAKQLVAERAARETEQKLTKQVEDAEHAANIRDQINKKLSVDLTSANRRLRDTTTALRNKLPEESCDAVRKTADAALTVFDRCTEQYRSMAENATGHASDVITITQACKKNEPD